MFLKILRRAGRQLQRSQDHSAPKSEKQCHLGEVTLFASEAKINVFRIFFKGAHGTLVITTKVVEFRL